MNDIVVVVKASNSNRTVICANSDVTIRVVHSNSSGALTVWIATEGTSSVSSGLSLGGVNSGSGGTLSLIWIPFLALVIITGGVDVAAVLVESPNLTVIMTLHDGVLFTGGNVGFDDGSGLKTDNEFLVLEAIDGSWENTELEGLLLLHGRSVCHNNTAVSST